jgi:hypothetical protein
MMINPRTHLGLVRSEPPQTLRRGRWTADTSEWPNMDEVDFRWDEVPVEDHAFRIILAHYAPPGVLWRREPVRTFVVTRLQAHAGPKRDPKTPGEQTAEFQPFIPDIQFRQVAKIAHGAAVAELGLDSFKPMLPDVILGKTPFISHLVGGGSFPRYPTKNLHEVWLTLQGGYLVAIVRLFARFGFRPWLAVVGRPGQQLADWHLSSSFQHVLTVT